MTIDDIKKLVFHADAKWLEFGADCFGVERFNNQFGKNGVILKNKM